MEAIGVIDTDDKVYGWLRSTESFVPSETTNKEQFLEDESYLVQSSFKIDLDSNNIEFVFY